MGIAANREFLAWGVLVILGTAAGTVQPKKLLATRAEESLAAEIAD